MINITITISFASGETLSPLKAKAFWDVSSLAASQARPGTAGANTAIQLLFCVLHYKKSTFGSANQL